MNTEQTYWFDSVPQHWQIKRLKDIASLNNDRTERKDMPYIALENIKSWDAVFVPSVVETDGINNVYHKGNVLFAKLRPYLAKGYITREDGICSTEFFVLSPNKLITNKYLLYYILSHSVIDYLKHQVAGTKMPRTTWDDFSNVKVALPPLAEQIKIANYLDDKISGINAQIVAREKDLQLLQNLKKAKVAEIITKGLSPNIQLKDSGIPSIGMIPAHWEVKRIKDIASEMFMGTTPVYEYDEENSNYIIGQRNNQLEGITFDGVKFAKDSFFAQRQEYEFLKYGDVLLNTLGGGSVGRAGYYNLDSRKRVITDGHIMVIRSKTYNTKYLYFYLLSIKEQLENMAIGSTNQSFFNISDIRIIPIVVPPIEEQIQIVEYLDHECEQIEKKCALIDKQIQQLQLLKRALINEVVTGKKAI